MTHRQRLSMIVAILLVALGLATTGAGAAAAAPKTRAAVPAAVAAIPSTPVTGTFTDAAGGAGSFAGTFTPTSFSEQDGSLVANGTLTGTLTDSAGGAVGTVDQSISTPAAVAQATCRVLDLTLGPLHLDLLGLVVDLNQVHLTINAVSAPGNLLGNLLCAIAGLLDPIPSAGTVAVILNLLLALLGRL
jgi:phage-related protein